MPSAWLFQDHQQKEKHGSQAKWYVAWIDNDGKKRTKSIGSKTKATEYKKSIEGKLVDQTFKAVEDIDWSEFRAKFDEKILPTIKKPRSRADLRQALATFEAIVRPGKVSAINKQTIDTFVAERRKQKGKRHGTKISSGTIRKELLWIHRALVVADEWGYIKKVPKIRLPKVVETLPRPVTQAQFEAIYAACGTATLPEGLPFAAAEWWRAFLLFAMTTGWRLSEILALRWSDVNLETGQIKTRGIDNKGGRDELDCLPELTIDHLKQIRSFGPAVFPWPMQDGELHDQALYNKTMYVEFGKIQRAAGIKLDCNVDLRQFPKHECSEFCHVFGFHDLRRAYATENMDRLPTPVLQKKMRHKSITTTLRYISTAQKMKDAAADVFIPKIARPEAAAS